MPPSSSDKPVPWWARAATGAIVGLLAAILFGAIAALLGLILSVVLSNWVWATGALRLAVVLFIVLPLAGAARSIFRSDSPPPTPGAPDA